MLGTPLVAPSPHRLLLGTCKYRWWHSSYQQSSVQGSKFSTWELYKRKGEGMWYGQGDPQMSLVMDDPSLDRERGHSFGASCTCSHGRRSLHICFPWQSFSMLDNAFPHFSLLIPHMQISTAVIQAFFCCKTVGEFHPQRICLGKHFINRKQTYLHPTRWSVDVCVLYLQ